MSKFVAATMPVMNLSAHPITEDEAHTLRSKIGEVSQSLRVSVECPDYPILGDTASVLVFWGDKIDSIMPVIAVASVPGGYEVTTLDIGGVLGVDRLLRSRHYQFDEALTVVQETSCEIIEWAKQRDKANSAQGHLIYVDSSEALAEADFDEPIWDSMIS
jgi:hypothetical protein